MSVIGQVKQFFSSLWTNTLKPDLQDIEAVAIAFFSAAAKDAASQLGVVGLKIITDSVTAAETAGGTGSTKLAAAETSAKADLASAGIIAASHILNAAIEGAVAQLNANNKAVTSAQ